MSAETSQTGASQAVDRNPNHGGILTALKPSFGSLNRDILWRVISLILEECDRDSNANLRRTSQVCASWRDLVLSSSSLWGRAVDITTLALASTEWMQEVIRRTGTAPLHITAFLKDSLPLFGEQRSAAIAILEDLFRHNWGRIKSLRLTSIRIDLNKDLVFEELLRQPAPNLEVFCVSLLNPKPTFSLFANDAPSLRECELSHIAFDTSAIWLPNVFKLKASSFFWYFSRPQQRTDRMMSPNQLLHAFSNMPSLEIIHGLDMGNLDLLAPTDRLPNVVLPRLKSIAILSEGNPKAFVAVLSHIKPAPGCSLEVDFRRTEGFSFTPAEIATFYAVVSRYLENYLKMQPLLNLSIYFNTDGRGIFKIEAGRGDTQFFVSVDLASPPLFVRTFFSDQNLHQFLSFEKAEVLTITRHMLPFFLRLREDNNSVILPRLRRLVLPIDPRDRFVEFHDIFGFLEWRWETGLVLDSIRLPMPLTRVDVHYNLSGLDRFTGLEVEWENGSERYLCGSGNPERLIFPMLIYL